MSGPWTPSNATSGPRRPAGISGLSLFFFVGCVIACTAGLSILFPGSFLEPMWTLNPRARSALQPFGAWPALPLEIVAIACGFAGKGLWQGRRWGQRLAGAILAVNLTGDALNFLLGIEPRAILGLPVALAMIAYLFSRPVKAYFEGHGAEVADRRRLG